MGDLVNDHGTNNFGRDVRMDYNSCVLARHSSRGLIVYKREGIRCRTAEIDTVSACIGVSHTDRDLRLACKTMKPTRIATVLRQGGSHHG